VRGVGRGGRMGLRGGGGWRFRGWRGGERGERGLWGDGRVRRVRGFDVGSGWGAAWVISGMFTGMEGG